MRVAYFNIAAALAPFAAFGQPAAPSAGPAPSFQVEELPPAPPASALANYFVPDVAGGLSRVIFETDEDPNFKITIRDFLILPNGKTNLLTSPAAMFVHFQSATGEVKIADQLMPLAAGQRAAVAARTPLEVTVKGGRAAVLRAVILQPK
jgi:hypothetical protein